ncbi:unnamed protein product [Spirodela intermedia]|uniref:Uncharacterized protein n=1 Tax=Spirodela intermedia TaxID=51605 RepID=A0A7I8JEL0_SPIIN|nr:unnamed protein product [Spirodela intermedia]CAA6668590.1 unnamed protein product [Spirodela intermedia]
MISWNGGTFPSPGV